MLTIHKDTMYFSVPPISVAGIYVCVTHLSKFNDFPAVFFSKPFFKVVKVPVRCY